ncbi:hypothetical protein CEE36_02175 [candidate division TA06 bacterium B3_TA06]|uniref:SbsA Ig-like domain-containing protein n=1 Tax=candidate division TA06 bacterium B3_TA06 TaxID=2012487 RepID=A0A532V9T6_UNCT6|nr:MAG: hypothetical protein CEE36_02175 [candidate division TA06 bacterium B3_TA06]
MQVILGLLLLGQLFEPVDAFGGGECYGVACVDLDRDGAYDVIIASNQGIGYYRNLGDMTFEQRRELHPDPPVPARAVLAGDLDNDSDIDLFVATTGQDFLLINQGDDITFQEITVYFPVESSRAAALVDFDADGNLDLFVAAATSRLYHNEGDASFVVVDSFPAGFAVSWADYDSSGWADFALASLDRLSFYRRSLTGEFVRDTTIQVTAPRGLCWFDWGNDGRLELAVADSAGVNILIKPDSAFAIHAIGTETEPSVAVAAGDFDGKPGVDLLFINYGIEDRIYEGPDFISQPEDTISCGTKEARSVALGDLDTLNGMDAVVVGVGGNAIYKSLVSRTNKLIVNLVGRRDVVDGLSNTIAAGTLLRLYEGDTIRGFWEIAAGSGHAGQDAPQKSFPLPDTTGYLLKIEWPRSGVVDSIHLDTFTLPVLIDAYEDITPPLPPSNLKCTSHDTLVWSNDNQVEFEWKAGNDPHGSGLAGYSTLWSKDTLAYPDNEVETSDTFMTVSTDLEGDSCFFFLSSVDSVGNVSTPVRYAPLKLDFHPPDSIELIHPSVYSYVNDTFVRYEWSAGVDTLSGIASYSMEVSNRHDFLGQKADSLLDTQDTFYQSAANLGEMWHYWRLTVKDTAGNTDTIPSQQNDTLGIPFKVDVTAPRVVKVVPRDGEIGIATNITIRVEFSEPMLPSSAEDESNYLIEQDAPLLFEVEQHNPYTYRLNPIQLLDPNTETFVTVHQSVTDLAGNGLAAPYSWSFRTGKAPDLKGPVIDLVVIDPNPTGGHRIVKIQARATDEDNGGGVPIRCVFFIDDSPDTNEMELADGTYNSPVELYTFDLDVDTFEKDSSYLLSFRAMDGSDNWGRIKNDDTLYVTDDVDPPELNLAVLSDTTDLHTGDTLSLEVTSNEPLRSLAVAFSQITEQDSFYSQLSVSIPDDSMFFRVDVHLSGFPAGRIDGAATGRDKGGNLGTTTFGFPLLSGDLLPQEKAFAAPNPASSQVGIYFTPGENVEASLRVFTIDGQEVWTPDPIEIAPGGERSVFTTDVSQWPVGLYIFVLQATNDQGQKAKVKKVFAVVR